MTLLAIIVGWRLQLPLWGIAFLCAAEDAAELVYGRWIGEQEVRIVMHEVQATLWLATAMILAKVEGRR